MEEVLADIPIHVPRIRGSKNNISVETARRRYIQDVVWTELSLRRSKKSASTTSRSAGTAHSLMTLDRRANYPLQHSSPRALKRANSTLTEKRARINSKGINLEISDEKKVSDQGKCITNSGLSLAKGVGNKRQTRTRSKDYYTGSNLTNNKETNRLMENVASVEIVDNKKDIPVLKCDILKEIIKSESNDSGSSSTEFLNAGYIKPGNSLGTSNVNSRTSSLVDIHGHKRLLEKETLG